MVGGRESGVRTLHGYVACVHTLDEEMVRHVLGKLRKICMARKEGEEGSGGEREPVFESLASGTSFSEGNRKPVKTCHPGSNESAFVLERPHWLQCPE